MLYEKLKVKKYLSFLFEFFSFFVFLSLFSMFFLCLLLFQVILGGLQLFWEDLFYVFKESTLQYLKKIDIQMTVFNKKAVAKISRISNLKSPPWNLVKFRSGLFLICLKKNCLNFFWLRINGKTIKNTWFLRYNAHWHICSICWRLDVFSLLQKFSICRMDYKK